MFPTFSGKSHRQRQVNLSGQKNINPFAGTSWGTGSAATGASKTVAEAAAERRQRQLERDRRQAVHKIQRVWRGHRVRRSLRAARRAEFDDIYDAESILDAEDKVQQATPLLLSFFDASQADDVSRLAQLGRDLIQITPAAFEPGGIPTVRLEKLGLASIGALRACCLPQSSQNNSLLFLQLLNAITHSRPEAITDVLRAYYNIIGHCCRYLPEEVHLTELVRAVSGPLVAQLATPFTQRAYHELVAAFLVQPDLSIFEAKLDLFAENIDVAELSSAVVAYYNSRSSHVVIGQGQELWLLAHFIGLVQTKRGGSRDSVSLKALYTQISYLSSQIKIGFPSAGEETGQEAESSLPQYVFEQLQSLVTKEGISGLLDRFTTEHSANSGQELEDASLLAAYTLTIIRTFPSEYGERILYPLVMTDIHTPRGDLPSIKFFWSAMSNTSVFDIIKSGDDATLDLLLRGKPRAGSTLQYGSKWDEEWRSILLFLELYVYVLKVTDDDDFFSGLGTSPMSHGAVESRVRKNCLALDDLLGLTLFLKHLAFTLLYNATQLHESELPSSATSRGTHKHHSSQTYSIISGIDYDGFSSIVTTAMRMLYERDSRRRFLPDGHWLMTSKFNMDSFLQAVIAEEERQRELKTKAEKDGDEDSDEESEADDDAMDSRPIGFMDQQSRRRLAYARNEMQKRNKRAEQERKLAAAGPKIEILRKMPFAIPFETRVQIFRQFVLLDKERRRNGHVDADRWRLWVMSRTQDPFDPRGRQDNALARHEAKVKRGQVFNDAMDQFYQLGDGLKEPIQITFVDQFDTVEAGIDGGGVTKEFLMSVTKEAFTEQHNLMVANSRNAYYPNPCALDQRYELLRQARVPEGSPEWNESVNELLKEYEFLGRIIGKCLYEGILIDIVFAPFFLLKWASAGSGAGYRGSINDLRDMDEELYQGLVNLEHHDGDISELGIDFTIEDQISFPGEPLRTVTRNLLSNGENMIVTNENRPMYTRYVAMHRLAQQPRRQTAHFLKGLGAIIEPGWLSMFNQSELQRLVGGDSSAIDVEDLRANTEYSGVYQIGDDGEEHPTIKMFWEVMHGLDDQERRDVLKYVTSTPRAPLLGFSQLRPPFTIRDGGQDQDRLPSASTCVNLLKLPQYKSAKRLKQKLLYAVTSGAGFDLS